MAELSQTQALLNKQSPRPERSTGLWVTSREAFWIALEALRTHKLRSFLTVLGVVIATTTLIVVMSVINGMNLYIADHIANLGANVFVVHQYKWAQGYEAWLKARRRNQPIRIEDFEFLRDNLKGYKNIGAEAWMNNSGNNEARYKGKTVYEVQITGETPNMIDIGQTKVEFRPIYQRYGLQPRVDGLLRRPGCGQCVLPQCRSPRQRNSDQWHSIPDHRDRRETRLDVRREPG